jgi:hypothetical protein
LGIAAVAVIVVGYAVWRSLPYAEGSDLTVFQPLNGSATASTTITVIGRVTHANSITLDGRQISVDEQGNFKEMLAIFPGINIIHLHATDRFGRDISRELGVLGL